MKLIAYVCTVKLIITQITLKEMKEKPETVASFFSKVFLLI